MRLAARWTTPAGADPTVAALVLPPPGYAHSSSFHVWRQLAAELAAYGIASLRVDLYGTGDSSGATGDVSSWSQWERSAGLALEYLASRDVRRVVFIGCDLSGSIVLQANAGCIVGKVVFAPVASGRRRTKELRLLGEQFPDGSGDISVAGTVFRAGLLGDIQTIDPADSVHDRIATLIVDPDAGRFEQLSVDWAAMDGCPHDYWVSDAIRDFLERPAEEATVNGEVVDSVAAWITSVLGALPVRADKGASMLAPVASFSCSGRMITEEFVSLGARRLLGVLTTQAPRETQPTEIVVLLNSGSDPHTGPGRAWVDFARELVTPRRAVLRLDFSGWGDSPSGPAGPGRPYDAHAAGDLSESIRALRAEGWSEVTLVGLCAGAWLALKSACTDAVDRVIAINPQMYWQVGDPVEALMSTTRARRLPDISEIARLAVDGVWDAEDARGIRPAAGKWLDSLASRRIPITMAFAANDDGIEYLRDRLGRRLRDVLAGGDLEVVEVADIDHGMQRVWLRPRMLKVIKRALDRERHRERNAQETGTE